MSYILLRADNKDARFLLSMGDVNIDFTPDDVNSVPLNLSDFQFAVPLIPMIAYTDGTWFIIVVKVDEMAKQFTLSVSPPSGVTVNVGWEVISYG